MIGPLERNVRRFSIAMHLMPACIEDRTTRSSPLAILAEPSPHRDRRAETALLVRIDRKAKEADTPLWPEP
ncbi:hypothetical protein [Microcoleus sp. M2_C2]|uniref:hypothetical protein n=1 Tax=unclassified Microcoleus TaxID=2642155 RepID=UPI002FD1A124